MHSATFIALAAEECGSPPSDDPFPKGAVAGEGLIDTPNASRTRPAAFSQLPQPATSGLRLPPTHGQPGHSCQVLYAHLRRNLAVTSDKGIQLVCRLCPVGRVELFHDVADVNLHCAFAHVELIGDDLVR